MASQTLKRAFFLNTLNPLNIAEFRSLAVLWAQHKTVMKKIEGVCAVSKIVQ